MRLISLLLLSALAWSNDLVCRSSGTGTLNWSSASSWTCKDMAGAIVTGPPSDGDVALCGFPGGTNAPVCTITGSVTVGPNQKPYSAGSIRGSVFTEGALTWADNGSGAARVTSSQVIANLADGDKVLITGATGTASVTFNDRLWTIANLSGNSFDLIGSTYVSTVSGGNAAVPPAIRREGVRNSSTVFGKIVVATGGSLTVKGDVVDAYRNTSAVAGAAFLTVQSGATFTFDGSNSTYNWTAGPIAAFSEMSNAGIVNAGTITSSGTRKGVLSTRTLIGKLNVTGTSGCTFSNLGSSTYDAMYLFGADTVDVQGCTFNAVGVINYVGNPNGTVTWRWNDNTHTSSVGNGSGVGTYVFYTGSPAALTTGTREIFRNDFDIPVTSTNNLNGFTIRHNIFRQGLSASASETIEENLIVDGRTTIDGNFAANLIRNNYMIQWPGNGTCTTKACLNGHGVGTVYSSIDGMIFEFVSAVATTEPECTFPAFSTTYPTRTFRNILVLPNNDGAGNSWSRPSCIMANFLGSTDRRDTRIVNSMAYIGASPSDGGGSLVAFGETATPNNGTLTYFRNNIALSPTGTKANANLVTKLSVNVNGSAITAAGTGYNACWLCAASAGAAYQAAENTYYGYPMASAPNTSTDISEDPRFVDPTRNFVKWAQARTGTASVTAGLTYITAAKTTRISDLMQWVRYGFLPQNPRYWDSGCLDAAFDGTCEGATYRGPVDPAPLRRSGGVLQHCDDPGH